MCTVLPKEAHEFQPGGWQEPQEPEAQTTGQSRAAITAELSEIWKDVE